MFGKTLRDARKKRKFTQQKLADTLNIALRTYQKYEEGSRQPPMDTLIMIADYFDVSLDYLLGRDDYLKRHGVSFDED